jgi:methionyl-tRNA formyltransferase
VAGSILLHVVEPSAERLRILFVTQDDPFYVFRFFEVFLSEYPHAEFEILGITIGRAFRESRRDTARRMFNFFGLRDFIRITTRFARASLEGRSIERLAKRQGVSVLSTPSVNSPEYVRRVRELPVDVLVSVAAPEIFQDDLLSAPRLGAVNIHSGRLPKYRGMMPVFWQMLSREGHATITVHEMVRELDAGRVLATRDYPLRKEDSLDRVMTETKREGARLMIEVLREMRTGHAQPRPLPTDDRSYFSFPTREKVAEFRRLGHRLL